MKRTVDVCNVCNVCNYSAIALTAKMHSFVQLRVYIYPYKGIYTHCTKHMLADCMNDF